MDLEEKRKKFAKWIDEYMQSVNLSLEEAFALSYFYGYEDCIAYRNLTEAPEEKRKKFAKWMVERMESVNMSLEEAFALSYFYGYQDCIADHNLTAAPVVN